MPVERTKISHKYQIVIPKALRERLKLKRGEYLEIRPVHGRRAITLTPAKRWPDDYIGLHADIWAGIDPVEYVRRERASWGDEE